MGLRLVTPDGRRITRLSRWVLRCTACYLVTKEMGRLFCPRCGNATMDKVQVGSGGRLPKPPLLKWSSVHVVPDRLPLPAASWCSWWLGPTVRSSTGCDASTSCVARASRCPSLR